MSRVAGAIVSTWILLAWGCAGSSAPPNPDPSGMEAAVQERITAARSDVLDSPTTANWGALGDLFLAHGLEREATTCYAQAAQDAEEPFVWLYLGALASQSSDDIKATNALFRRAIERQPEQPIVQLRHALFLQSIPRPTAAAEAFRAALARDPVLARAHRGLGESLLALDQVEAAIAALEQALELEAGDKVAGSALAQAYLRAGRAEEAADVAATARRGRELAGFDDPLWSEHVVRNGVSVARRFERAQLALRDGNMVRAREQVAAILVQRKDDADAHYLQALIESRSGAIDAAQMHFERALEADPSHLQALLGAAALAESAGLSGDARGWIERAQGLAPGDPTILVALAANRRRAGDLAGLTEVYEKLVEIDPELAALRLDLGRLYEESGRRRLAIEAYRRAIDLDPSSAAAERLRALGISGD